MSSLMLALISSIARTKCRGESVRLGGYLKLFRLGMVVGGGDSSEELVVELELELGLGTGR